MRSALAREFPLRTGELRVAAVERPAARLARIVFEGPELADLPDEQPGEMISLIWPAPGRREAVLPGPGWRFPPGTPPQHCRNFTIRSYDRGRARAVVDFVLHGDAGPASAWARRARPGDRLWFGGPRAHYYDDPGCEWALLAGDETALPSIAATLARAPAGQRLFALVESDGGGADRGELADPAGATVTWVEPEGPAPHRSRALERAVRELPLPAGPGKVWVAGEAGVVRGIRTYLRDELGLAIGPRQAIGYWKHRETPGWVERDAG